MTAWPIVSLDSVAVIDRQAVLPGEIETGTLYVGLENISGDGSFTGVGTVDAGELASGKFAFSRDHILYGKLRPYLRKIARPSFSGICSTDILPIRPRDAIDRDYLAHFLRLDSSVSFVNSRTTGANLPRISPSVLLTLEVPLPPIGEQQRIAAMLDQAEGLRAKRRQALSKLDTLNHSLFLEMFGDPRSNTRGLPTATVGKLLTLKSGNFLPASKMAASGVHPVYGGNGVNGHHDEYMFEQRVISIGRVGVYCGVVHLTEPRSWVTDNSLFVAGFDPAVSQGYLCEALKMANLNQYASQSGQPLISASRLSDVRLLIPPIRDQLQFEGVVAGMNTINAQVQRSSGFIDDLFSSLQQRAFTGEL